MDIINVRLVFLKIIRKERIFKKIKDVSLEGHMRPTLKA